MSAPPAGTRVLVTGAGGFIASHLIPRLLDGGCVVLAQEPERFAARLAACAGRVQRLDGAWGEPSTEQQAAGFGPQVVFNLAGYTDQSHSRENDRRQFDDHLGIALSVVRASFGPGLQRLVHASTNEEYGNNPVRHREDMREMPISAYSAAKAAVTHYLQMLARSEGLPVVLVRPFLVYGPGQGRGLVHAVGQRALRNEAFDTTEGRQTRDFTYVDDVVEGLLDAATVPGIEGQIFNLGTGVETEVREAVTLITRLAGGRPHFGGLPTRPGEMMRSVADPQKSRESLGWRARVSLEDGLRRTLEALRP
ncbi:MAG: NAD-dependent epimerase/dehydratase family protein [Planctomycetota bacterium]|nr:MAG: NAD-dependent epimerase/dehydratase family protein [Planctomycetota bacterium]